MTDVLKNAMFKNDVSSFIALHRNALILGEQSYLTC